MKLEKELKEVFDFYALASESKNKTINFTILTDIVNKIGIEITKDDLKTTLRSLSNDDPENIPYSVFLELFERRLYKEVPKKNAIEAFQIFDKDKKGRIQITDFRHVLVNLADTLTPMEIDEFLALADQKKDGYIYYTDFVEFLSEA